MLLFSFITLDSAHRRQALFDEWCVRAWRGPHRGISLFRKQIPLGPYRRPMPRVLGGVLGGWAFSYEQGTPVLSMPRTDARTAPSSVS